MKNGVKNIQAEAFNGAPTVYILAEKNKQEARRLLENREPTFFQGFIRYFSPVPKNAKYEHSTFLERICKYQ